MGRAGRLSGNSLIIALVRAARPGLDQAGAPTQETIAGSVTAPAAYLSARGIMHRQFIAYLFDTHSIARHVESLATAYDVFNTVAYTAIDALIEIIDGGIDAELEAFCGAPACMQVTRYWKNPQLGNTDRRAGQRHRSRA